MKRLVLLTALLSSVLAAQAGDYTQAFGLQVGYANPIYRLNQPAENNENKTALETTQLRGAKIGLVYDATFWKGFGCMLGLNYTAAGYVSKWEEFGYDLNGKPIAPTMPHPYEERIKYQFHQLELFVDWQYKFEIARNTWLILYTGPTIQCVVHYQQTDLIRAKASGEQVRQTIIGYLDYSDADIAHDLKRVNVTWGVGAGFQYDRYYLRGGYDFGLINPYNFANFNQVGLADRNTRGRLDQWQIKLGVYLWRN